MAKLWGKQWTRDELLRRVAHNSQLGGIERFVIDDGPGRGMRALRVDTGSGLVFTVLADRCLDISAASFRGTSFGWRPPTGDVAPGLVELRGMGLMRGFTGGLLTTCGLQNVGPPSQDAQGAELPQHGRIHSIPTEGLWTRTEWEGDELAMELGGLMRQARLGGENMTLKRRISTRLGEPRITIDDEITNEGYTPQPLMILYHFNFGAPLVSERARVDLKVRRSIRRSDGREVGPDVFAGFGPPQDGVAEEVYFHDPEADAEGMAAVRLTNPDIEPIGWRGIEIVWHAAELPRLAQWVYPASGGYVMGLEPTNTGVAGQAEERRRGTLTQLAPGQALKTRLEVRILLA